MRWTLRIIHAFALIMLLQSCIKDDLVIIDKRGIGQQDTIQEGYSKMTFYAVVETPFTKTVSSMPADRIVDVYCYNHGGPFMMEKEYKTNENGTLTPVDGEMIIPLGKYDFYIVSSNSTTESPPSFPDNTAGSLSNNVDYLSGNTLEAEVRSSNTNISFTLNHACAQVVFQIVGETDDDDDDDHHGEHDDNDDATIVVDSIISATIVPPSTSKITWSLLSGSIVPVTTISSTPLAMTNIGDNTIEAILLPWKYDDKIPISLELIINLQTTNTQYMVYMTLPDQELISGNSYQFLIEIDEEGQSQVSDVMIADWIYTDVDKTIKGH